MRLLLIEDDSFLIKSLKPQLQKAGYAVEVATDGVDGCFLGMEETFDAVILDLGLPQKSGLELLREWREAGNKVPVIILTARDTWHEKVDGLKAGADDYLSKPFHPEELIARLEAVIRRHHGQADNCLCLSGINLDLDRQEATDATGNLHPLSAIEFRLLHYLMLNPDRVLSKSELSEHIYEEQQLRDSNVIEVYINKLRQRFGYALVETRRGQGYLFRGNK